MQRETKSIIMPSVLNWNDQQAHICVMFSSPQTFGCIIYLPSNESDYSRYQEPTEHVHKVAADSKMKTILLLLKWI